jgi:HEAT repeat protein
MQDRPQTWNTIPVPYDATVQELVRQAQGAAPDRWAAFVALAYCGDEAALDFLRESAESRDPHVRRIAAEAIGARPDGSRLESTILSLLSDSHGVVVRAACEAAGQHHLAQCNAVILRLLDTADASTREVAVRTLRSLWSETDCDRVLETFTSDPDQKVRKEAAWTLREVASPSTWQRLFAVWQANPLPRHRRWAAELAAAFGDEDVLPQLRRLAADTDGHVRDQATDAIRALQR